jgi:hypothetical protein
MKEYKYMGHTFQKSSTYTEVIEGNIYRHYKVLRALYTIDGKVIPRCTSIEQCKLYIRHLEKR